MKSWSIDKATGALKPHDTHVEEEPAQFFEAVTPADLHCERDHTPNAATIAAMREFAEDIAVYDPALAETLKPSPGLKYDTGKLDWTLVPFSALEGAVRVLMFGANKYARENWKKVENGEQRYLAAGFRHMLASLEGQEFDQETGIRHTAHVMVNLMFAEWLRKQREGE